MEAELCYQSHDISLGRGALYLQVTVWTALMQNGRLNFTLLNYNHGVYYCYCYFTSLHTETSVETEDHSAYYSQM